jgi:hypothetical protein
MNLLRKPNRIDGKWAVAMAAVALSLLTVATVGISAFSFQVSQPGSSSSDVQQFVGEWTAMPEGARLIVLELRLEKGGLAGGMRICSFNLDMEGGGKIVQIVDKTLTESPPARNFKADGKSLSFDWKDPDGDETHWKLETDGADSGSLRWVELPDGRSTESFPVTREGAKTP